MKKILNSLGYALQRAASDLLELDSREIGMLLVPVDATNSAILFYDNVPGGAGHARELISLEKEWLERARQVLFVDSYHHKNCTSACMDCILTYDAQFTFQNYGLDRKTAFEILDALMNNKSLPTYIPLNSLVTEEEPVEQGTPEEIIQQDKNERLKAANKRKGRTRRRK